MSAGHFGNGPLCLHGLEVPGVQDPTGRYVYEMANSEGNCYLFILDLCPQSVMNFGILMVQGLINSFGVAVMAAFAAAVKIDSFAYMPVQDFGNAFSTLLPKILAPGK